MALQKQSVAINFSKGVDLKSDPYQLPIGNFLALKNTIFNKAGLLQKRNGFKMLGSLPDTTYKYLTTFNGNLTAVGPNLAAYSSASSSWLTKGSLTPLDLDTLPLIRSGVNQSQGDAAVASNGLVCTVYTNTSPSTTYSYAIADSATGQNIVAPTLLSTPTESPRVFLLNNYFIILFSESANLSYIAIPVNNPTTPGTKTNLVTNYAAGGTMLAFDGVVFNNNFYVAYNGSDGGGAIRMTYLNAFLVRQTPSTGVNVANAKSATMMSVCADSAASTIWVSFYKTAGTTGSVLATDIQLNVLLTATQIISSGTILNITSSARSGSVTVFTEVSNAYTYGATLPTNFINKVSVTSGGSVGATSVVLRSVGLASKSFILNSTIYMLAAYSSSYQPSYFLIDSTGKMIAKLAYENGGGYLTLGLPSASINSTTVQIPYLIKDLIQAANKAQNPASPLPVFTQTGINLVSFNFTTDALHSSEIGSNLNISGGFLYAYDGYQVVEEGFNLYPDNVIVTTATTGGLLKDQTYFYQAIYEWTDNQGNVHRSAPSIAVSQVTTGGNTSTNTIKVPTLRITYKTSNPVKIILYRWSTAQQTYYQVTSLTSPTLNDTTVDNVTITDTLADASIVGNSILYTTGGVVENVGAPATTATTLFKSRLFLIDAEDRNLLWYSKQVIEASPVEMSDLFTIYVAPTQAAQGNTGPMTALSAMDDKLIIFKKNAIYYMTGVGPDNTGSSNDFSDPVFVTSTVGCDNQNSIVFIPNGIIFQSDKGLWLLGRDLSTSYIGAAVEDFNSSVVLSAITVPGTNQVRFTLNTGEVLMYDYFYNQWGTFKGVPSLSSTLYQKLHTFIDSYGRAFQENPGVYLDGANPVLISFTTGWFNVAGLSGYQRIYDFILLATYISPHRLVVSVAYDFNPAPYHQSVIIPTNTSALYGGDATFGGGSPFGGQAALEQWRVDTQRQLCQSFQINLNEVFDATSGIPAGAGFSMSGINCRIGVKKSSRPIRAAHSVG